MSYLIERHEDMSPIGRLRLIWEDDGDIVVAVIPDPEESGGKPESVQFCTVGSGGGRSPKTLEALRALFIAMRADLLESPIACRCCHRPIPPPPVDTTVNNAFHRAWTLAVGKPGYVKEDWIKAERLLFPLGDY